MKRLTCLARWLQPIALSAAAILAAPAQADVDMRVESRPISDDIEVFVRVTTDSGIPVDGLTIGDFAVTLNGVALTTFAHTLPPAQDPNQRLSVIFAMDYSGSVQSTALTAMQDAVISFIEQMDLGDHAAILKFNNTRGAAIVQPFTEFDGVGGTGTGLLTAQIMDAYSGTGTNLLDAVALAVETFANPGTSLPPGPKAVILISDGGENSSVESQSDVVALANNSSLPIFTIGVGNIATDPARDQLLSSLAEDTGGDYFPAPDDDAIADAYLTISESLNNEYLLTIPTEDAPGCDPHTIEISVAGQAVPASVTFTRCDSTPDAFDFTDETGVAPNSVVTSDDVEIVGIDTPVAISVSGGEYSIGCNSNFTTTPGTIAFSETVCVRHTASANFSSTVATVLIVGGVSSSFSSTTRNEPRPSGNGGGGGAAGVFELLLGLGALLARRRRRA